MGIYMDMVSIADMAVVRRWRADMLVTTADGDRTHVSVYYKDKLVGMANVNGLEISPDVKAKTEFKETLQEVTFDKTVVVEFWSTTTTQVLYVRKPF